MPSPRKSSRPPSRHVSRAEKARDAQLPATEMDGYQMTKALVGARTLASERPRPPAPVGQSLARFIRILEPEVSELEKQREQIVKDHGLKRDALDTEKAQRAVREVKDLYEKKLVVLLSPIHWDDFEGQDIDGDAFAQLGPLGILPDVAIKQDDEGET